MPEIEKFKLSNLKITQLLNKEFVDRVASNKKFEIDPTHIMLLNVERKEDKKIVNICPIMIGHQSKEEVEKGIVHVDCSNSEVMSFMLKILKDMGAV